MAGYFQVDMIILISFLISWPSSAENSPVPCATPPCSLPAALGEMAQGPPVAYYKPAYDNVNIAQPINTVNFYDPGNNYYWNRGFNPMPASSTYGGSLGDTLQGYAGYLQPGFYPKSKFYNPYYPYYYGRPTL